MLKFPISKVQSPFPKYQGKPLIFHSDNSPIALNTPFTCTYICGEGS